ncbi:MAG: hypothetical protein IT181_23275 [Acidobacteria bacterium]|nr:hypothetical protein [Acidobacteriota bacterium]
MLPPLSTRLLAACAVAAAVAATPSIGRAQTPPPQIVIGATVAQRQEAARALIPLLKDVRTHAQPGATMKPGTVPNSPFAGTQTTLFAFTLSKRSVPVDQRVVRAMNELLDWNIGASGRDDLAQLFDRWLIELEARSSGAMRLTGGGLCDVSCVVKRMTTLDETWGSSPRNRGDVRDELLLDALKVAVLEK